MPIRSDNWSFLCESVAMKEAQLHQLGQDAEYVIFCAAMHSREIKLFSRRGPDPSVEEEIRFNWDAIVEMTISKFGGDNDQLTFKLNKEKCGYEFCTVIFDHMVFDKLFEVVNTIYFYLMRERYDMDVAEANKYITTFAVFKDLGNRGEGAANPTEDNCESDDESAPVWQEHFGMFDENIPNMQSSEPVTEGIVEWNEPLAEGIVDWNESIPPLPYDIQEAPSHVNLPLIVIIVLAISVQFFSIILFFFNDEE